MDSDELTRLLSRNDGLLSAEKINATHEQNKRTPDAFSTGQSSATISLQGFSKNRPNKPPSGKSKRPNSPRDAPRAETEEKEVKPNQSTSRVRTRVMSPLENRLLGVDIGIVPEPKPISLDHLKSFDHELGCEYLFGGLRDLSNDLCQAVNNNQLSTVKDFMNHPVLKDFINLVHPQLNRAPLFIAARGGYLDIVLELLNTGCVDVDQMAPENAGTALHAASYHDKPEVVALLLVAGASPTIKNGLNLTPHQEAKGKARDVYQTFSGGGNSCLSKRWPQVMQFKRFKLPDADEKR